MAWPGAGNFQRNIQIPILDRSGDDEPGWDNSTQGVVIWLNWADSLEPLILAEQEESEAEARLKRCDRRTALKLEAEVLVTDEPEGLPVPSRVRSGCASGDGFR